MDLITATAVLVTQAHSTLDALNRIVAQCHDAQGLASRENSTPDIDPQIKGIIASIDANMASLGSQTALLQGAIDEVARLVN
jgi:hypothetical protein